MERATYRVDRMTALAGYDDGARATEHATMEEAAARAWAWTMSEPWRRTAYLTWYADGAWHRDWYYRDMAVENPRPLVVVHDR